MFLFFYLLASFSIQYQNFLRSPASDSIFAGLVRGDYKISDFKDNPVILWFWRSSSGSAEADSFLKKLSLERNFFLSSVLRWEAKEVNSYQEKLNKLELAFHFDSLAIENFLSQLALAIKHRKFQGVLRLLQPAVFADVRNQIFLSTNILILLGLAVFMSGIIFVLIKTVFYLPVLCHRMDPVKHNQFTGIGVFLIMLVPVLTLRQPYLIFVIYSVLLILVFTTPEKNWLRLHAGVLVIIAISSFVIGPYISFLKGTSRSYQLYKMLAFDSDIQINPENTTEKEILAYTLKKQKKIDEALSLYEDLYKQGNHSLAVINNLANIYFLYDLDAKAETLYRYLLHQQQGEPYFNLGLLKLKNIEYSKASEYLEEARKRGFSSLSKEPVDIKPYAGNFHKVVLADRGSSAGLIKPVYILPFFIIFILSFLKFKFRPPFYCPICAKPVCKDCLERVADEIFCKACFVKLKSTKSPHIEADLRRLLGRRKTFLRKFFCYLSNIIVPGAGLIYQNRNFAGLAIVFLAMLGYVPLLFTNFFIKPTGWVALSIEPILFFVWFIILIPSYIISFMLIKGAHAV